MKKLKIFAFIAMLVMSGLVFASCGKVEVSSVEFQIQSAVLAVGDSVDLDAIVSPDDAGDKTLSFSSSDSAVAYITPDNKVLAMSVGSAIITAKSTNGKTGYKTIEVRQHYEKLSTPLGLTYSNGLIMWNSVLNATSYVVKIGETEHETVNTFVPNTITGQNVEVVVKAVGNSNYLESEYSEKYTFKVLSAPTGVAFNKVTNTLSWDLGTTNKFKVKVNGSFSDVIEGNSKVLSMTTVDVYNISVIAVGQENEFDSQESQVIVVERLANVDQTKIVWNANSGRLSWDAIENANYQVTIDDQTPEITANNYISPNLSRGLHTITVKAVGNGTLVLDSNNAVSKQVAITQNHSAPTIASYSDSNNRLLLSGVGDATRFEVKVNGQIVTTNNATSASSATITFAVDTFKTTGEYIVSVKSLGDAPDAEHKDYYNDSLSSSVTIVRLAAPILSVDSSQTKVVWERTNQDSSNSVNVSGSMGSSHYEPEVDEIVMYSRAVGMYDVSVSFEGDGNFLLSSAVSNMSVTKLATPTVFYNKTNNRIEISADGTTSIDVSIDGVITNTTSTMLTPTIKRGSSTTYSFQAVPTTLGQIRSNPTSALTLSWLDVGTAFVHVVDATDNAFLQFSNISSSLNYEIRLTGQPDPLEYTIVPFGEGSKIKLTKTASQLYGVAGTYNLSVLATSSDNNVINSQLIESSIIRLSTPTIPENSFDGSSTIRWNASANAVGYRLTRENDVDVIESDYQYTQYEFDELGFGTYVVHITANGNGKNILPSEASELVFTKSRRLAAPELSFNKSTKVLTISSSDENATMFQIDIGDGNGFQNYAKESGVREKAITLAVSTELMTIKAKMENPANSTVYTPSNESVTSVQQLAKVTSIYYSSDSNLLTWGDITTSVSGATVKYRLWIDGVGPTELPTVSFSTANLTANTYTFVIQAYSDNPNVVDGVASDGKSEEIVERLPAPTSLAYNKSTNVLTFEASVNSNQYEIQIKKGDVSTVKTVSEKQIDFDTVGITFEEAGVYTISVVAKNSSNTSYRPSVKSSSLSLTRLASPTGVTIANETVSVNQDLQNHQLITGNTIKIDGDLTNSLATYTDEITINASYTSTQTNVLDSAPASFVVRRLQKMAKPVIVNNMISWSAITHAQGYALKIMKNGEVLFNDTLESSVANKLFNYTEPGDYDVTIIAVGDNSSYLNSYVSDKLIVHKLQSPVISSVSQSGDMVEVLFSNVATGMTSVKLYNHGALIGELGDLTGVLKISVPTELLIPGGNNAFTVKAFGNNSLSYIDSEFSAEYDVWKLNTITNIQISGKGIASWNPATYSKAVSYFVKFFVPGNETAVYGETIDSTTVDLSSYIDATTIGTYRLTVRAIGNGSTYLNGGATEKTIERKAKPTLVGTLNGLTMSKSLSVSNYILKVKTVDGSNNETTFKTLTQSQDSFVLTDDFVAGKYKFYVNYEKPGYLDSVVENITIERLNKITGVTFVRDAIDEDKVYAQFPEVEHATAYVLQINSNEPVTVSAATRRHELKNIDYGPYTIKITTIGQAGTYFNSSVFTQNATKLSSALNVRKESGVLTWENNGENDVVNYKLIVNDSNGTHVLSVAPNITTHSLETYQGQISIRIKVIGNLTNHCQDSEYSTMSSFTKLAKPTMNVVSGEFVVDVDAMFGSSTTFELKVGELTKVVEITKAGTKATIVAESMQTLLTNLQQNTVLGAEIRAVDEENYLTSDYSSPISFKLLSTIENLGIQKTANDTIANFVWSANSNASSYLIRLTPIEGQERLDANYYNDVSPFKISQTFNSGNYAITVRGVGTSYNPESPAVVPYLSSLYAEEIDFKVLQTPEPRVENGVIVWDAIGDSTHYVVYDADSVVSRIGDNFFSFVGVSGYTDQNVLRTILFSVHAASTVTNVVSGNPSIEKEYVKPKAPHMVDIVEGGFIWGRTDEDEEYEYKYYDSSSNRKISFEFMINNETVKQLEIDVAHLDTTLTSQASWPFEDNYFEKYVQGLESGEYTLKIQQIGNSDIILTTEYTAQTKVVNITRAPENVRIENHKLVWNAVELPDSGIPTSYVVYAKYMEDSQEKWKYITETTDTFFDVSNKDGLIEERFVALCVATKGNTEGDGTKTYVTGNKSPELKIQVLSQVGQISTEEGVLVWNKIADVVQYSITFDEVVDPIYISDMGDENEIRNYEDFASRVSGEYTIQITAEGNVNSTEGEVCIINGKPSLSTNFTKLSSMTVVFQNGKFAWNNILGAEKYGVSSSGFEGVDYNTITIGTASTYESTIQTTDKHFYYFQAVGNSVIPREGTIAYVSSSIVQKEARRLNAVEDAVVENGLITWKTSSETDISPHVYLIEFLQEGVVVKSLTHPEAGNIDNGKVRFDVSKTIDGEVVIAGGAIYDIRIREMPKDALASLLGLEAYLEDVGKLATPQNVHLSADGTIVWDEVERATGYKLKMGAELIEITGGGVTYYVSDKTYGTFTVSLQAISDSPGMLWSAWANKDGEIGSNSVTDNWTITQIPALSVSTENNEISYVTFLDDESVEKSELRFTYSNSVFQGLKLRFVVRVYSSATAYEDINFEYSPTQTGFDIGPYKDTITKVQVKSVPIYGRDSGNEVGQYFASPFSIEKTITKPDPIENLVFDETSQLFTWDYNESITDVIYIVKYSYKYIDGLIERTVENQTKILTEKTFAPMHRGIYNVSVQVERTGQDLEIGRSSAVTAEDCVVDLFSLGQGTESDPYRISETNVNELASVCYRPFAHYVLTSDITYNLPNPIGYDADSKTMVPFTGHFSGIRNSEANYKISSRFAFNLSNTHTRLGIFGIVGTSAVIEKFDVEMTANSVDLGHQALTTQTLFFGLLAGEQIGGTIQYIHVLEDSFLLARNSNGGELWFGSIVGRLTKGTVDNCISSVSVTTLNAGIVAVNKISKFGGIAGVNYGKVSNCVNSGNIVGATQAGGICGMSLSKLPTQTELGTTPEIVNCQNTGAINGYANSTTNRTFAGGVVGSNGVPSGVNGGIITGCSNVGTVTINNNTGVSSMYLYAGGIAGFTKGGTYADNTSSTTPTSTAVVPSDEYLFIGQIFGESVN